MGLQVQGLAGTDLKPRVMYHWACRKDLQTFKEKDFPYWLSRNGRSTTDNDKLGVRARWAKQREFLNSVTISQAQTIVTELCDSHAWEQWQRDGSLCVKPIFSWLWEGITVNGHHEAGIGKEIDDEVEMYRHHLQDRN